MSAQDVEVLAAVIRRVDGAHTLGAAALAEAILSEGYAVVELPEPEPREDDAEIATCWDHLPHQALVWDEQPDEVQLCYNFEPAEPLSPDEACALGAALIAAGKLAAANKAEAVGDE